MSETSRRRFLQVTALSSVAAIPQIVDPIGRQAQAAPSDHSSSARLPYPRAAICKLGDVTVDKPVNFSYPDPQSPCLLIKAGKPIPGGIGPGQDLLAYSLLCPHQGCAVNYDTEDAVFRCPCHFSKFDAEKKGQMICGQATGPLPKIEIVHDEKSGQIMAQGVGGLIYGRQANIF